MTERIIARVNVLRPRSVDVTHPCRPHRTTPKGSPVVGVAQAPSLELPPARAERTGHRNLGHRSVMLTLKCSATAARNLSLWMYAPTMFPAFRLCGAATTNA